MATTITSENLKICMLNFYLRHDNFEHNVRLIERLLELSVDQMPDIIVTPELAVSGYCFYNELGVGWIATEVPMKFPRWSRRSPVGLSSMKSNSFGGIRIICSKSNLYFNSAFFIDEPGELLDTYHKVNVLQGWSRWSSPGKDVRTIAWRDYKIGLLIYSDLYSRNIAGALRRQGVDVLISPAAWYHVARHILAARGNW